MSIKTEQTKTVTTKRKGRAAKEYDYNLLSYDAIKNFQRMINSKMISKDELYEIITKSDLYNYLMNQDTRYIYFYGNPEFDNLKEYREDLSLAASERTIRFIYQTIKNDFNVESGKKLKFSENIDSTSIKSYFLKNFKGLLIREALLPISQYEFPRATAYTQELLNSFHKSAGYEKKVSSYSIESIMKHINNSYNMRTQKASERGNAIKERKINLKTAFTVWEAYTPFGQTPTFDDDKNRKYLEDFETSMRTKHSKYSTEAPAAKLISAVLDYNLVDKIARELFIGKDYDFFRLWFDQAYFTNDCMSSVHPNSTFAKKFPEYIESNRWTPVQKKIDSQRIVLIQELIKRGLISTDTESSSKYTQKLLKSVYECNITDITDENIIVNIDPENVIDFASKKAEIETKNTSFDNIVFSLEDEEEFLTVKSV
jgi:hypothetical protein